MLYISYALPGRVQWRAHSEEHYWDLLIEHCLFQTVYADDGGERPLIDTTSTNLSQTPREQCEIKGLIQDMADLAHDSPGRSVIIQGLVSQQQLNGCTGRVLPLTGRGALAKPPTASRIPVRLSNLKTISCRPENVTYHDVTAPTTSAPGTPTIDTPAPAPISPRPSSSLTLTSADDAAEPSSTSNPPPLPSPTGRLANLVRSGVRLQGCLRVLTRKQLLNSTLAERSIKCRTCKDGARDEYVAKARTVHLSPEPVSQSVVKLLCVDCLIRAALAAGVPVKKEDVAEFVLGRCMKPSYACNVLEGVPVTRAPDFLGDYPLF